MNVQRKKKEIHEIYLTGRSKKYHPLIIKAFMRVVYYQNNILCDMNEERYNYDSRIIKSLWINLYTT